MEQVLLDLYLEGSVHNLILIALEELEMAQVNGYLNSRGLETADPKVMQLFIDVFYFLEVFFGFAVLVVINQ